MEATNSPLESEASIGEPPEQRGRRAAVADKLDQNSSDPALDALADWLTTSEVADLTGLDKNSVRRYVWRGVLPEPVRKGNFLLWRRAEIETWIAERRPMGRPKKG